MKSYRFKINGREYNVDIDSVSGNNASVTVNGKNCQVELMDTKDTVVSSVPEVPGIPSVPRQSPEISAARSITSPLPGVIIDIMVNVGDTVRSGQEVAVLEAMKMENSIEATSDGTVTAIHVSKGESVLEGAAVITIA